MNIKIQGGGSGTYANTGSCTGVTTYLQHEDLERMKNGQEVQPFFNNSRDYISAQEVTFKIDNNKAKLSRNDAKFYVITVSPSSRELEKMGKTEKEQAEAMRKYVRDDVMHHRTNQRLDGQFQDATEPVRYNCFKLDVLELLGICSLVIEENFTKTKSLNHFFILRVWT